MSYRRDQVLQKMGITQYTLRQPYALKEQTVIGLSSEIRLVIISDDMLALTDPLVDDVLHTLHINYLQVQILTLQHLHTLPCFSNDFCWWFLGAKVPKIFTGIRIISPTLHELYHNYDAKRSLWKQIYQYKLDIITRIR
ncbi:DNA polymerase III subunit psi [Candidatus Erwinia haradaeae]|uniref:DNA polymerase III subunit psi n=1 Tax=Candidatus Erwinia haradaeae TaxID=1922217 RepID=A0A451DCX5_9GAMM|nr:DNA polymerase III subunit psi [Candidatus Erwinia haradaeae]VFP84210.1 DNA polymerase III subunit psi [Candidatus Erwinia haradaeae]